MRRPETWLITGGCGFIGCNMVARLLGRGKRPVVLDDLSRPTSMYNLEWLQTKGLNLRDFHQHDIVIDDLDDLITTLAPDVILHLAAQVAVTTSLATPLRDLEVNTLGTLNVLEAARQARPSPIVLFASTNKVYGPLLDGFPEMGISEETALDPCTPYGCSKAAADQYTLDYARIHGLRTAVFRQSCCYGNRQFGTEDQGWVAHFMMAAIQGHPVVVYGDGEQVRDCLWVEDLLDAYDLAWERLGRGDDEIVGQAFNIGGGPDNQLTPNALAARLGLAASRASVRPGDQHAYVSDIRKASRLLGWTPAVGIDEGLTMLQEWAESIAGVVQT